MAKFDKDTFKNDISQRVVEAMKSGLLSKEDVQSNDIERLTSFIKYVLMEYIEDRRDAINILTDFNYDDRYSWDKLEDEYGTFKSLMDIALVNLMKFIENQNMNDYSYYLSHHENDQRDDSYSEEEFEDEDDNFVKYEDSEFDDKDDNEDEPKVTYRRR